MKKLWITLGILLFLSVVWQLEAQEVKINDNFVVESDGTVRYDNSARVWDDIRVSLNTRGTASSPTYTTVTGGLYAFSFDGTKDQSLYFEVQMPHSWKEGTTIYPHVHWINQGSNSGVVTWGLEYTWQNIGGDFSGSTTSISSSVSPSGNMIQNINNIGSGIDGTGKRISSILLCRLYRLGTSDANNDNSFLIAFDIHYEIDTAGSRDTLTK